MKEESELNEATGTARAEDYHSPNMTYFAEMGDLQYAGTHLIIDLWGARGLDDLQGIRLALNEAALACGATVLDMRFHSFTPNGGVTGVALLSQSHISIHSWPEAHYAALDIFVCGPCDPYQTVPVLREAFAPEYVQVTEHKRGIRLASM